MKKLSFILPVYNVEKYLEKCVKSIRDKNMPYNEYEIIVINDGSPDNSEILIKKLQNEIPNIVLINQDNAGVSVARNKGIEIAKGEYLVFIDPDDFVNPDLLNKLYNRAKKDNLDILLSGRSRIKPNGLFVHQLGYELIENRIFDGISAYYEKDKTHPIFDSSVGRLYRRELIKNNNILYPAGVIHIQDGVFVRKIFTVAKRVGFSNYDFYQVFERPGSTTRSSIAKKKIAAVGDIRSVKDLINFRKMHDFNKEQLNLINTSIIKYTLLPLMRAINSKDFLALVQYHRLLKINKIKPVNLDGVYENEYKKYAKALNRSLWIFVGLYIYNLIKRSYKSKNA